MKAIKVFALSLLLVVGGYAYGPVVPTETIVAENRCGWFVDPTSANAWLTDVAREWII